MVNYAISKNIHLETKKEFFLFSIFSRNYQNISFLPFQVRLSWKFLLVRLQVIWIFLHSLCLAGFAKFWGSKRLTDFVKCSVFCFFSLKYLEKKRPSGLGPSTYSKNFSSNEWNQWICRKGGSFWSRGLWKSMKMRFGKFVSMTTFALLFEVDPVS